MLYAYRYNLYILYTLFRCYFNALLSNTIVINIVFNERRLLFACFFVYTHRYIIVRSWPSISAVHFSECSSMRLRTKPRVIPATPNPPSLYAR